MDYYKDTPPLEFISDVYDIMKDGDCLSPERLIADVVNMLGKYLSAQQNMHLTSGSMRHLLASFWLRVLSALKHFTSLPTGRFVQQKGIKMEHAKDCAWLDPLPTGEGYWGCSCGYSEWLIEHEDDEERPTKRAVLRHLLAWALVIKNNLLAWLRGITRRN